MTTLVDGHRGCQQFFGERRGTPLQRPVKAQSVWRTAAPLTQLDPTTFVMLSSLPLQKATSKELDSKWSSQDTNRYPRWMPVSQVVVLPATSQHQLWIQRYFLYIPHINTLTFIYIAGYQLTFKVLLVVPLLNRSFNFLCSQLCKFCSLWYLLFISLLEGHDKYVRSKHILLCFLNILYFYLVQFWVLI